MTKEQMIEEMGRIYEALEGLCFTYKDEVGKIYYSSMDAMWYTDPPSEISNDRIIKGNDCLISEMKSYLKKKMWEYQHINTKV